MDHDERSRKEEEGSNWKEESEEKKKMEVGCFGGLLPTILLNSLLGYTIQPNDVVSTTAFYLKSVLLILVHTSFLSTVEKSAVGKAAEIIS